MSDMLPQALHLRHCLKPPRTGEVKINILRVLTGYKVSQQPQVLIRVGLSPRLQTRMNMNAPPGTVLRILAVFSHPPQDSLIFISAFL